MASSPASPTRVPCGPLITTFSAPSACAWFNNDVDNTNTFWQGQLCTGTRNFEAADCLPPMTRQPTNPPSADHGFYSPGLICPSGQHTACSASRPLKTGPTYLVGSIPSYSFAQPLLANETAYGCCPTSMTCTFLQNWGDRCASIVTNPNLRPVVITSCGGGNAANLQPAMTLLGLIVQINRFGIDSGAVSSTAASVTTASAQSSLATTRTGSPSTQATSVLSQATLVTTRTITQAAISTSSVQTSGPATGSPFDTRALSTGAIVGIAVGALIAICLVVGLITWRRYKRRQQQTMSNHGHVDQYRPEAAADQHQWKHNTHVVAVHEMAGRGPIGTELAGCDATGYELAGRDPVRFEMNGHHHIQHEME